MSARGQRLQRADGDVAEIADRRRHQIERRLERPRGDRGLRDHEAARRSPLPRPDACPCFPSSIFGMRSCQLQKRCREKARFRRNQRRNRRLFPAYREIRHEHAADSGQLRALLRRPQEYAVRVSIRAPSRRPSRPRIASTRPARPRIRSSRATAPPSTKLARQVGHHGVEHDHAARRRAQPRIADRRDQPFILQDRQPRRAERLARTALRSARGRCPRPAAAPSAGTRRPLPIASASRRR